MSLKGYILPVAVVGLGVAIYGVPKARSYVSEIRHVHEVRDVRHLASAAQHEWEAEQAEWCREYRSRDRRGWYCEVREVTYPATAGTLEIDAGGNGGIDVEGWDRSDVLVRAKVQGRARTDELARELVSEVQIETSGASIRARGPKTRGRESWAVSFRVSVPVASDLSLRTVNGGIEVDRVLGDIEFHATNGGISLLDVGGGVRGRTTNGGIEVALAGDRWSGDGLDVRTTNGGIELLIPDDYNAVLESGTVNGHLEVNFPITVQGKVGRKLQTTLGEGGPLIRAMTTNGGVSIRKR